MPLCFAMSTKRAKSRGVTLVELVVAVLIVAILAAIAFPSYQSYAKRARRKLTCWIWPSASRIIC